MSSSFFKKIIHLESVDSTNNYAAILISEGKVVSGTVILADEQTMGKGQRGASWSSESGLNLLMSIILLPDNLSVTDQFVLSEVTALALNNCLKNHGIESEIKWPNDILVNKKKIAGILIENQLSSDRIKSTIIGIGLNVNQDSFSRLNACSMKELIGKSIRIQDVLYSLLNSFEQEWNYFIQSGRSVIEQKYLELLSAYNELACFEDLEGEFQGIITGVNKAGQLLIKREEGLKSYDLKEIKFIFRNNPSDDRTSD